MSQTIIFVSELTHYFNADEFNELGYQRAIAQSETIVFPKKDTNQVVNKFISKTNIELFDFAWLDTSTIDIFYLGKFLQNYKVEYVDK